MITHHALPITPGYYEVKVSKLLPALKVHLVKEEPGKSALIVRFGGLNFSVGSRMNSYEWTKLD